MKKNIFISFILVLLLYSCDYYDNRLVIKNNTNNNISVTVSADTALLIDTIDKEVKLDFLIKANSQEIIVYPGSDVALNLLAEKSFDKKLHIFVLEEKGSIHKNDSLTRIDLSIKELEKNKWVVNFPK